MKKYTFTEKKDTRSGFEQDLQRPEGQMREWSL